MNQGRVCPSIDLVVIFSGKIDFWNIVLKNSSVLVHRSTFRESVYGFMQKRPRSCSIPSKLSVATLFNNGGKLDRQLSKLWVSRRSFNKRDLWNSMHWHTRCCKLSRSTDRHDPNKGCQGAFFCHKFATCFFPFFHIHQSVLFFCFSLCISKRIVERWFWRTFH